MRKGFFLAFLILSCVQVLYVLALEDLHKLEDQDLKVSKHLMAAKETSELNDDAEDFAAKNHAVFPEKSQRAKGSYGGANLVHHRPDEKSAAPILKNSPVLIPTSIMCISLFFLSVLPVLIV